MRTYQRAHSAAELFPPLASTWLSCVGQVQWGPQAQTSSPAMVPVHYQPPPMLLGGVTDLADIERTGVCTGKPSLLPSHPRGLSPALFNPLLPDPLENVLNRLLHSFTSLERVVYSLRPDLRHS
jgi:hypothetical protein